MASVLTIDGSTINRSTTKIKLNRLTLSMDNAGSLAFTELCAAAENGTYHEGQAVSLDVDSVTVFSGVIVSAQPSNIGNGCISIGYQAMDLRWLANLIPITAADGTGRLVFNVPRSDYSYLSAISGKSVGDILKIVFDLHSSALSAYGITGYTEAELDAITVVPPEPVVLSGRLWNCVVGLLSQWCNKYVAWIDGDGLIHVANSLTDLAETALELDTDPITLDSIRRDHSESYTRVVVRGQANVDAAYLSLIDETITKGWDEDDEDTWTINDFYAPGDASDTGDVTAVTSTTITVQSDDAARTWATNFWGDQAAWIYAYNPVATGITFQEQRRIISHPSLSVGGTCTLTVETPFANSGYTRYAIRGERTTASLVYRKFEIANEYVAQHLLQQFGKTVPWSPTDSQVSLVSIPVAVACWSESGDPPYLEIPANFQLIPYDGSTNGYILFDEPVVRFFSTREQLELGGASVVFPSEIKMLVPYSRGALTATKPDSGYEGTAYTVDDVERTLTLDYPSWRDSRDATSMAQLAQEHLDTAKDTVVEGTLTYHGKLSEALVLGRRLNIGIDGGTTGWEAIDAPIKSVTLEWPDSGASIWMTRLSFSTRRRPFAGDRLYVHPAWLQSQGTGAWLNPMSQGFGGFAGGGVSIPFGDQNQSFEGPEAFGGPMVAFGNPDSPARRQKKAPGVQQGFDEFVGQRGARDAADAERKRISRDQDENMRRYRDRLRQKAIEQRLSPEDKTIDDHLSGIGD